MKQHTLQEIADFFGCFVAYGRYSSVFSCPREPRYSEDVHGYVTPYAECFLTIPREIISDFSTHDPRVLVRPKTQAASYGELIQQSRVNAKMTMRDLANKIGAETSPMIISQIEHGEINPTGELKNKLQEILHIIIRDE